MQKITVLREALELSLSLLGVSKKRKKKKKLNKKGQCDLGSHPYSVEARFKSPVFMTERDALSPRLLVLQMDRKIEFTEVHGTCRGDA